MAISNTSAYTSAYSAYSQTTDKNNLTNKKHAASGLGNTVDKSDTNTRNSYSDIKDTYAPSSAKDLQINQAKAKLYGNTLGQPKLSDTAAEYYEELKKKYSNLNFVLVSSAEKDNALSKATKFNNGYQITTVIDEEKIERMATDPEYRAQMEQHIDNAIQQMNSFQSQLEEAGLSDQIAGMGVQVNDDGTISYFAVLKDMSAAQKERIEKKQEESREEKREAKKEEAEERLEKISNSKLNAYKAQMTASKEKEGEAQNNVLTTVTAASLDDLFSQITTHFQSSDSVN